ncbi:SHOCT domain-containing protein [Candidatus Pelagibacter bacterium]|nr:SHOCT domain-containing protein [Candidatus Pelagibacter bacterium]MDA9624924.1 SHOCT domain-containing protein [Candidatus Pelagibacter bacterium]
MKKLLAIVVLGLLLSGNVFAKTINIEDKVLLKVPENFNYIKIETDKMADYYEEFFSSFGEQTTFYYVGTDETIEFANVLINDQDKLLEPIIKKMEKKNFSTEKSAINFISKELKKLMKKYKYEGVIWVLVSEEKLEDTDYDLFEIVESLKNMNQADMNKAALEFKKEIKDELSLDGVEGLNLKISKFKIEKNKINSPAFDLKIAANMFNINWDMEIYGYLKNNKPIIVGSECIGKCKSVSGIKNMIVYSNTAATNTSSENSSNIVENLNKLNDLYKSGVLTKEEFEKAKKKLLN